MIELVNDNIYKQWHIGAWKRSFRLVQRGRRNEDGHSQNDDRRNRDFVCVCVIFLKNIYKKHIFGISSFVENCDEWSALFIDHVSNSLRIWLIDLNENAPFPVYSLPSALDSSCLLEKNFQFSMSNFNVCDVWTFPINIFSNTKHTFAHLHSPGL